MDVRFDKIDETLEQMNSGQLLLTLQKLAIQLQVKGVVDQFDYVDAVKLGLSWPK